MGMLPQRQVRLFSNGRIFISATDDNELHEAMAVHGRSVSAIGKSAEVESQLSQIGLEWETIDLKGKIVLPGFIDAHTHLGMLGSSITRINCLGKNIVQIQDSLRAVLSAQPDIPMLLGRSFLFDALGHKPDRSFLDEVSSTIPIFIDSADLHTCWLSSAALDRLGIDSRSRAPKGGSFEKDENGRLTGLLLETAVSDIVWPWLAEQSDLEERVARLKTVFGAYLATGVTGVVDMAMTEYDIEALEEYHRRYHLPVRVYAHWLVPAKGSDADRAKHVTTAAEHRQRLQHLAPWLQVVGIKIISDGVVDSCTAYLSKPYSDGSNAEPIWPRNALFKVVQQADALDLQIAIHAIGDAASENALDAFEAAVKINGPRPLRRHRIEHLEVVSRESIDRIATLGVTASLQPVHADPVYVPNWRAMLGEDERCDRAFPWTEYVHSNAHMAFGSDAPTAPHHVCPNLYTATTRQSGVNPELPRSSDPRIIDLDKFSLPLETAIRSYTLGSARSVRAEQDYGSLEAGKYADFCVLAIDPFAEGVETLRVAQEAVLETWIGGELVWSKPQDLQSV